MYRTKLSQFGLDRMTGIEIDGEGKPFIKDPVRHKKWVWHYHTLDGSWL